MDTKKDNLVNRLVTLNDGSQCKIIERLSRDADAAMSSVYLVEILNGQHQPSSVYDTQQFAIKIVPKKWLQALQREAKHLRQLDHENVIQLANGVSPMANTSGQIILETRIDGETLYFLMLRYYNQGSLKDLLAKKGGFSIEETVGVIVQLSQALDYIYEEKNIVHLDVKPTNILVDNNDQVVLSDFGVSRHRSELLNIRGKLVGTPRYSAPEKFNQTATPNRTVDIFSIGIIIYEMLTGDNLLGKEFNPLFSIKEAHYKIKKSNIPPKIQEVIIKATAEKPIDRYSSARLLSSELKRAFTKSGKKEFNKRVPILVYLSFAIPVLTFAFLLYYILCTQPYIYCYW